MTSTWVLRATGCTAERQDDSGRLSAGLLGIKNTSGFDVEVRHILMETNMGRDTADSTNPQPIYRLTALTGGTALSVNKHDTTNAALPSQVSVVTHPDSFTRTDYISGPGQLAGTKLASPTIFGSRVGTARMGIVAGWFHSATFVQPMVLREGQGQYGSIYIRNQATGATYSAFVRPVPIAEQDVMIAVFNGTGSGVILEVLWVESNDIGYGGENTTEDTGLFIGTTLSSTYGYRIVKCADLVEGEAVTPLAMDTTNAALDSHITFWKNPLIVLGDSSDSSLMARLWETMDVSAGTLSDYQAILLYGQHLGTIRPFNRDPTETFGAGNANFPRLFEGPYRRMFRAKGSAVPGFVVKQNECIAIVNYFRHEGIFSNAQSNTGGDEGVSSLVNYNLVMEFTVSISTGQQLSAPSANMIVVT